LRLWCEPLDNGDFFYKYGRKTFLKILKYSFTFVLIMRFKRTIIFLCVLALSTFVLEACAHSKKNRCETCPGVYRKSKAKGATKGSI
jgi:hypothetical protein